MPAPISMLRYNTVLHCPMIATMPLFKTRDAVAPVKISVINHYLICPNCPTSLFNALHSPNFGEKGSF